MQFLVSQKSPGKLCLFMLIQFSKYMYFFALPKDNYFLCFSPLPLDGDILRFFFFFFLTGITDIPAKYVGCSQTYKEVLETLEETGRSFNALWPSFC